MIEEEFLAKSEPADKPETLLEHTIETVKTFIDLIETYPENIEGINKDQMIIEGLCALMFHDMGKLHEKFQTLLKTRAEGSEEDPGYNAQERHELLSLYIMNAYRPYTETVINAAIKTYYRIKRINITSNAFNYDEIYKNAMLAVLFHHKYMPKIDTGQDRKFLNYNYLIISCDEGIQNYLNSNNKEKEIMTITNGNTENNQIDKTLQQFKPMINPISRMIRNANLNNKINQMARQFIEFQNQNSNFVMPFSEIDNNLTIFQKHANIRDFNKIDVIEQSSYDKNDEGDAPYEVRKHRAILLGLIKTADHLASGHIQIRPFPPIHEANPLNNNPYPYQQAMAKIEGNVILTAPTGSGKTEAALLWAKNNLERNQRMFYILPYTASINAMYFRLTSVFDGTPRDELHISENVAVAHSKTRNFIYNLLEQSENENGSQLNQNTAQQIKNLIKEIYFPVKISTAHQLLKLLFFGKNWEQQLAEIQDGVFIFDEIHAYDPHLFGMVCYLIKLLIENGGRICIMTATMPKFITENIRTISDKDFTNIEPGTEQNEERLWNANYHRIKIYKEDIQHFVEDNLQKIIQRLEKNEKQLIFCNTVNTAIKIYEFIKNEIGKNDKTQNINTNMNTTPIKLLHSRFCERDRREIERKLIETDEIKILVSTQVVEVSLDIDFKYGYSENAPIDAIIQRMGRINRHTKKTFEGIIQDEPNFIICERPINSKLIYPFRMEDTIEKFKEIIDTNEHVDINAKTLRELQEQIYADGYTEEEQKKFDSVKNAYFIRNYQNMIRPGLLKENIEDILNPERSSITILPHELKEEYVECKNSKEYIKAESLLITLNWLPKAKRQNLIEDGETRCKVTPNSITYSSEFGLRL